MFNLVELQQQRAHKALTAKEIIDKAEKANPPRPTTDEENQIFDRLQDEIKSLDGQITAIQAHNRRSEESAALLQKLEQPVPRITEPDKPGNSNGVVKIPATARRTGALKAFKPRSGETVAEAEMRAYRSGLWARAALFNDQRAMQKCLNLGITVDLRNAMGTTSQPDGGVLVPDEMSQSIIDLREMYGLIRKEARVWPMGSDTLKVPRRSGGITIGPVGENPSSAISQSNPTFNLVELVARKAGGLCLISSEISEDAIIDLADWIASEFAYAFSLYEDQCAFIGDGTSTYMGIRGLGNLFTTTGSPFGGQLAGAVDAASGHDTFAEIDNADLTTLMGKLPAYALPGAAWYCSAVAASVVFNRLAAVAGGNNTQTLREGVGLAYLGYPIKISQVMPTSTGDLSDVPMLYFGDMSKSSQMGDRRQVKVFPSEHRYMDTDQIGIRGTERFDIVHSDVGDNSTPGPIVALVGE